MGVRERRASAEPEEDGGENWPFSERETGARRPEAESGEVWVGCQGKALHPEGGRALEEAAEGIVLSAEWGRPRQAGLVGREQRG